MKTIQCNNEIFIPFSAITKIELGETDIFISVLGYSSENCDRLPLYTLIDNVLIRRNIIIEILLYFDIISRSTEYHHSGGTTNLFDRSGGKIKKELKEFLLKDQKNFYFFW